jgi:hypothetical protein
LRFRLEINSFLQIQFSVGSKQRATTTLDFEHVLVALSFLVVCLHSLTLFAPAFLCVSHFNLLTFVLSQTCHIFVSSSNLLPYSGFQFLFFVGRVPNKPFQQHWTVHVQYLYISCYVTVNKPVLSYLLSRLLLQTAIFSVPNLNVVVSEVIAHEFSVVLYCERRRLLN